MSNFRCKQDVDHSANFMTSLATSFPKLTLHRHSDNELASFLLNLTYLITDSFRASKGGHRCLMG